MSLQPNDDSTPRAIVALIVCSALALLAVLVFFFAPAPAAEKYALLILGALIAFAADVKQFYFGSSSGSRTLAAAQTATVNRLTDAVATSAPVVVSPPDERVKVPPPSEPTGFQKLAADSEFAAFAKMVRDLNPAATDADIARAWSGLKGVDIPT